MENTETKTGWEKLNLWVYNLLSAVLPYSTPLPIAILTARSAERFLELDRYTAGILVFGLEGLGLLCTSLLVDAVVQWVRSRSWRTFVPVMLFGTIVYVYIRVLVSLNVTLKVASGNDNPALTTVITLLCYVPLISGVINGWNKLRIENRSQQEQERIHNEQRADQLRREQQEQDDLKRREQLTFEREKIRIQEEQKTARTKAKAEALALQPAQVYEQKTSSSSPLSNAVASIYKEQMKLLLNDMYRDLKEVPTVRQIADHFELDYEKNKGYISTLRKKWAEENGVVLTRQK